MSNNNSDNSNAKSEKKSTENKAVTGVEVVKDDTVVYEDGDFENYNANHDYKEESSDNSDSDKSDKDAKSSKDSSKEDKSSKDDKSDKSSNKDDKSDKSSKDDKSEKSDKADDSDKVDNSDSKNKYEKSEKEDKSSKDSKEGKSDKKSKSSKKDKSDEDDKSGITMAGIYQWASKLKDDFTSDASGMTQGVSEKATAMMLGKLIDAADLELTAFDKSLDVAKNLLATAEERREKIIARKEKYQGMINDLDQE